MKYIIDPILPTGEVHLIGGPSGVGKSTEINQILDRLDSGRSIFGYPPPDSAVPWTYISCDRSAAGMERTLDRLRLPVDRSRYWSRSALPRPSGLLPSVGEIIRWCSTPLLIIEALTVLLPQTRSGNPSNNYTLVGSWLMDVSELCQKHDKTIIATVHSAKAKAGEGYADLRQKVLGSVAFAAMVETIFLIDRAKPEDETDPGRIIHVLPRNAAETRHYFELDSQGMFRPALAPSEADCTLVIESIFQAIPSEAVFETSDIIVEAEKRGVSRASVFRWLQRALRDRRVERVASGRYKKLRPL